MEDLEQYSSGATDARPTELGNIPPGQHGNEAIMTQTEQHGNEAIMTETEQHRNEAIMTPAEQHGNEAIMTQTG